jgi:hypothetical protein
LAKVGRRGKGVSFAMTVFSVARVENQVREGMRSGLFRGDILTPRNCLCLLGQRRPLGSVGHCEPIAGAALVVVSLGGAGANEDTGLAGLVQESDKLRRCFAVERHWLNLVVLFNVR